MSSKHEVLEVIQNQKRFNLKPCPFCKFNLLRIFHIRETYSPREFDPEDDKEWVFEHYHVSCGCGAQGPHKDTESLARRAWNTRVRT